MEQLILYKPEQSSELFFNKTIEASQECLSAFYRWFLTMDTLSDAIIKAKFQYIRESRPKIEGPGSTLSYNRLILSMKNELAQIENIEKTVENQLSALTKSTPLELLFWYNYHPEEPPKLDIVLENKVSKIFYQPSIEKLLSFPSVEMHDLVLSQLYPSQELHLDLNQEILNDQDCDIIQNFFKNSESFEQTIFKLYHLAESHVQGKTAKNLKRHAYQITEIKQAKQNFLDSLKKFVKVFMCQDEAFDKYFNSEADLAVVICTLHKLINKQLMGSIYHDLFVSTITMKVVWNGLLDLINRYLRLFYFLFLKDMSEWWVFEGIFIKEFTKKICNWAHREYPMHTSVYAESLSFAKDLSEIYLNQIQELKKELNINR